MRKCCIEFQKESAADGRTECPACREIRAKALTDLTELKKQRGECIKCPNPAVDGITFCSVCVEKSNSRQKRQRDHRRGIGLCVRCGSGCIKGKALCSRCSKKENAAAIKKRNARADMAVCIQCGDEIETGFARCEKCLEYQRKTLAQRNEKLRALGKCWRCGKSDRMALNNNCYACVLKQTSGSYFKTNNYWMDLDALYHKQNGLCPYLGLPITIGVNAELDHIVPKAKGGTNDLSNFQWVHVWANVMKADMLEEDFTAMLHKALPKMVEADRRRNEQRQVN